VATKIDFGRSEAAQLATLIRVVQQVYDDLYGNGDPGLKRRAEQFMSEAEGMRKEQERQHEENSVKLDKNNLKLNIILAVCAILTLILGACGTIIAVVQLKARSEPPSHTQTQSVASTTNRFDASN